MHQSRRPVSMVHSHGRVPTIDALIEADRVKPRLQESGDFIFYTLSTPWGAIAVSADGIAWQGINFRREFCYRFLSSLSRTDYGYASMSRKTKG